MRRAFSWSWAFFLANTLAFAAGGPDEPVAFEAGAAREDITPPTGIPMWGYGARKQSPCQGVLDPLTATAIVIRAGGEKLAIVALDIGRSPARESLRIIREALKEKAGVAHVIIAGSHTHHGPCLELEKPGLTEGSGATAEYVGVLREKIVAAVVAATRSLEPARIGAASDDVPLNRNRHSKIEPKAVDRRMTVLRLETLDGKGIATLVNYAGHPTTREAIFMQWSADYPAALRRRVEKETGGLCAFLQGASGDMSVSRHDATKEKELTTDEVGDRLGGEAVRIARSITTGVPKTPAIETREEEFRFTSRIALSNPITYAKYCLAFFKDLVDAYVEEYRDGVRPSITVVLLDREIGIVAASGEFFANHAIRLRERARLPQLLFLGYANGYHQYFPTIEAVSEGGYGADPDVSPVEIGAGERMMDRALFHLYDLRKPMK